MKCKACGAMISDDAKYCDYCGSPVEAEVVETAETTNTELPMNWHKFLCYFGLWAGAVLNLISGIMILTGYHYQGQKEAVYRVIPKLKTVDGVFGILMIAFAALCFVVAYRLLRLKRGAPKELTILYVAGAIIGIGYAVAAAFVLRNYSANAGSIVTKQLPSAVGSLIFAVVNAIYYKKREHLFVN